MGFQQNGFHPTSNQHPPPASPQMHNIVNPNMVGGQSQPIQQPPPQPPPQPPHHINHHGPSVEVSFPLSREKACRFREIAESDHKLIRDLQKFGIHSIRFQGLTKGFYILVMFKIIPKF
jgi:hypothetical protein